MKPNFALSLAFDRIRLLHRAAGGWRIVGDVRADAPDLPGEIAVLRKTATALESGGLRCKLVLPNEQIKYMRIDAPDRSPEGMREAARRALNGATPYAVDELAFDVAPGKTRCHVAAVAWETLEEAERFAVEHKLHPVSFVAAPEPGAYPGEPFFGQTQAAAELLAPGETITRDSSPVVVLGRLERSATERAQRLLGSGVHLPPAAVMQGETAGHTPLSDPDATPDPEPAPAPQPSDPTPQSPPSEVPAPETPPSEVPQPSLPEELPRPGGADTPDPSPGQPDVPQPDDPQPEPEPIPAPQPDDPTPTSPPSETPPSTPPDEVPSYPDMRADPPAPGPPPAPAALKARPGPVSPAAAGASLKAPTAPLGDAEDGETLRPGIRINAPSLPPATAESRSHKLFSFASRRSKTRGADRKPPRIAPAPAPAPAMRPAPAVIHKAATLPAAEAGTATQPTTATKPTSGKDRSPETPPASEVDRMTIFGARRSAPVGGKPRFLGLMLTAALLVVLAGVAAWASVFLDDGQRLTRLLGWRAAPEVTAEAEPEVVPLVESAAAATTPPTAPGQADGLAQEETPPETEAPKAMLVAQQEQPESSAAKRAEEPAAAAPAQDEAEDETQTAEPASEADRDAQYAVTGIWATPPNAPPAPELTGDINDLYLTSIDPVSTSTDAVALPGAKSFATDQAMSEVAAPAAAGTKFDLDSRGLVVPTAKGAISPDGVLVIAGRPAKVPPSIPTRFEAPPEDNAVRSALAQTRPKDRPDNLIESSERAQFDGLTRAELGGIRPTLRPRSKKDALEDRQTPAITIKDTDTAVTVALKRPSAFQNATAQATDSSKRPDDRPENFAKIVTQAKRQAAAVPPSEAVVAKLPSNASVSKRATVGRAIDLRKINLIGVYGKPANRRALIRLSNGRYQKVEVGDRIDGGRVSAIGETELHYTKRGRSHVLVMPKG